MFLSTGYVECLSIQHWPTPATVSYRVSQHTYQHNTYNKEVYHVGRGSRTRDLEVGHLCYELAMRVSFYYYFFYNIFFFCSKEWRQVKFILWT